MPTPLFALSTDQLELMMDLRPRAALAAVASVVGRDVLVVSRNLQHLAETAPLLIKESGRWRLTPLGREAAALARCYALELSAPAALARDPRGHLHVAHNMILYGENELFVSHLVYKRLHNYQVILPVRLDERVRRAYLAARREFPGDTIVLLLDPVDISQLGSRPYLSGANQRLASNGQRVVIEPRVRVDRRDWSQVYFAELPLSLDSTRDSALR